MEYLVFLVLNNMKTSAQKWRMDESVSNSSPAHEDDSLIMIDIEGRIRENVKVFLAKYMTFCPSMEYKTLQTLLDNELHFSKFKVELEEIK